MRIVNHLLSIFNSSIYSFSEAKTVKEKIYSAFDIAAVATIATFGITLPFISLYHDYTANDYTFLKTGSALAQIALMTESLFSSVLSKWAKPTPSSVPCPPRLPKEVVYCPLTTVDWNQAFSSSRLYAFTKDLNASGNFQFEIVPTKNQYELQEGAAKVGRFGSMILFFHGRGRIFETENGPISSLHTDDVPGLDPHGNIVFVSCKTGVVDGVAQAVSKAFPFAKIYAPTNSASHIFLFPDSRGKPAMLTFSLRDRITTHLIENGAIRPFPLMEEIDAVEEACKQNGGLGDHLYEYCRLSATDDQARQLLFRWSSKNDLKAIPLRIEYEEKQGDKEKAKYYRNKNQGRIEKYIRNFFKSKQVA